MLFKYPPPLVKIHFFDEGGGIWTELHGNLTISEVYDIFILNQIVHTINCKCSAILRTFSSFMKIHVIK